VLDIQYTEYIDQLVKKDKNNLMEFIFIMVPAPNMTLLLNPVFTQWFCLALL